MDKQEKYELIESYLANEMPDEQRLTFEAQLSADKELFDEVALNREINEVFKNDRLHVFIKSIHEVDSKWQQKDELKKGKVIKMNMRIILAIAATLLICIFTWQFLLLTGEDPAKGNLFASNFEPYHLVLSQRSEAEPTSNATLLNLAIQEYAAGNYPAASDAFRQLHNIEPENISYKFYLAVSLLGADNAQQAVEVLEELLENDDHLFTEQSRWYLALAYISVNDNDRAVETLQNIMPDQFNYAKSRELISELK